MPRITPLDIINKQFASVRKGYDPSEVAAFMEEVRDSLEETLKDQRKLQGELRELQERLEQKVSNEDQIKDTLVLAKKLSEDLGDGARREADLVVGEARLEAQRIISSTHDTHRDLVAEVTRLRGIRVQLVNEMRAVLSTHQTLLEQHNGQSS